MLLPGLVPLYPLLFFRNLFWQVPPIPLGLGSIFFQNHPILPVAE